MADNKLEIEVLLSSLMDKQSAKETEKQAAKIGARSGEKFEENFTKKSKKGFSELGTSLKALGGIVAGIGLFKVFSSSIEAAKRQEDAINQLNSALQITGKFSTKASLELQKYASSLQLITKFGDEAILETQALIQSLGNLSQDELKRATKSTLDLAAALGIDLRSAATLVGKAAAGEVGSFSRYGVSIKKAENNALTFANALDALEKKFGGAAEKQLGTFSGATEQAGNAFGDLLEGFGAFVTKNPLIIKGVNLLTSGFSSLATTVNEAADSFNNLFKDDSDKTSLELLNAQLDEAKRKLIAYKKVTSAGGVDQFTTQGEAFKKQIPILEKLIKGLERRKKILEEPTSTGDVDTSADEKILLSKQQLSEKLKTIGLAQSEQLKIQQRDQLEIVNQAEEQKLISRQEAIARRLEIERSFSEQLTLIDLKRRDDAINASGDIGAATLNAFKEAQGSAVGLGKTLQKLAVEGYGKAFQNIGRSLAKGESASSAFEDAAKEMAAGAASAVGDYYILDGAGRVAKSYGADATGYKMIAAGSALKVLSGTLMGGSSSTSSGSSSGGVSAGNNEFERSPALAEPDNIERQAQSQINITVEGSLVQQEELGSFISKVISEGNEKNGNIILNPRFV